MGYKIKIGELDVQKSPEDGLDCECIRFSAKVVRHDNAPAFVQPADFTNESWPSYTSWTNFLECAGLYDVFFYENGHLVGGHPGVRLVTQAIKARVDKAIVDFQSSRPNLKAKFDEGAQDGGTLCRLTWLKYWIDWSLENCETPVIANS